MAYQVEDTEAGAEINAQMASTNVTQRDVKHEQRESITTYGCRHCGLAFVTEKARNGHLARCGPGDGGGGGG